MWDPWEISVTKIGQGEFSVSYVEPDWGNVHLDSEDLVYVGRQRSAVHEFGHMRSTMSTLAQRIAET